MWAAAILLGSLFLVPLWFFNRTADMNLYNWFFKCFPFVIASNVLYWYGFRFAPDFVSARYTMSASTHIFGWLIVIFMLHEPIVAKQIVGVGLIIIGSYILK